MKIQTKILGLAAFMVIMPNVIATTALAQGTLQQQATQFTTPLHTPINIQNSLNVAYRRGGVRRGGPAYRGRTTVRRAAPIRHRTIRGSRMRWYTAGVGIALVGGRRCYANQQYGRISGKRCCIGSQCHSSFYVD